MSEKATPEFFDVVRVRSAPTRHLTPALVSVLDTLPSGNGEPDRYAVTEDLPPMALQMYPTPEGVQSLDAKLVVRPTQNALVVDDRLFVRHREAIVAYAKYVLMGQAGTPWGNAEQAALEYRRFVAEVGSVNIHRAQGHVGMQNRVVMHPFT